MQKVSELVSSGLDNMLTNMNTWGKIIYNVTSYGAKADGSDIGPSVLKAAADAALTGGTILFPPSSTPYKLEAPISLYINNVELVGYGATIDCRGTGQDIGNNGVGGAFSIVGSRNKVLGLSFFGYAEPQGSINYGTGKFLRFIGDLNNVVECNFKDGNSGAIMLNGNKNTVYKSNFDTCNNHAIDGADYGSIHVLGGYGNTIDGCWIENQYYAGITLIGNAVSRTTIKNCYIKCSNPLGLNTSMGIYAFNGAAQDLKIIGNTIENVAAEAIAIFSSAATPTDTVKITGNTLRDYDGTGIAIYKGTDNAISLRVIIKDNTLQSITVDPDFHIYTEMLNRSSITNNNIYGRETGTGTIADGIYVGSSPTSNIVKNNQIFNVNLGIFFADTLGGDCSDNEIVKCTTGMQYQNCNRAKIKDNTFIDCPMPLSQGLNADYAFVAGNMYSGQTTLPNRITIYDNLQTTAGATTPYATGTLVAGSAALTFYNIDPGDAFVAIPTSWAAEASCGSLYIAAQNPDLDTIVVKSTNSADTRKFMVIKIARGGLS